MRVESKDKDLTFEAALSKLESVVESMESGEIPLDELLQKFEQGNKLLKTCETRLKDAELKIEKLKKERSSVSFTAFKSEGETS